MTVRHPKPIGRVARALLILLATLCVGACGKRRATPNKAAPATTFRASGVVLPAGEFPSTALFGSSGWFEMTNNSSLHVATQELLNLEDELGGMSGDIEETMTGTRPSKEGSTDDATSKQIFRRFVPGVFARLRPLWDRSDWAADEVAYANAAAAFMHKHAGAPTVAFTAGRSTENKVALVKLADWFRTQARDADWLGASFFTMDDGPMVGTSVTSDVPIEVDRSLLLGDALVLECCRSNIEGDTGGIFRLRDGDTMQWTRRLTRESGKPHQHVRFSSSDVKALGPYGWHINFSADREGASLYIGPTGRLLFYFVSW